MTVLVERRPGEIVRFRDAAAVIARSSLALISSWPWLPSYRREFAMRRLVLVGAVLMLAAIVAASARASDHRAGKRGSHAASAGTDHVRPSSWFARYPGEVSPPAYGGFIDLGPLGFMAACGAYPRGHGYCGPNVSTPIDAWSY
jgi:hypothetical protein